MVKDNVFIWGCVSGSKKKEKEGWRGSPLESGKAGNIFRTQFTGFHLDKSHNQGSLSLLTHESKELRAKTYVRDTAPGNQDVPTRTP